MNSNTIINVLNPTDTQDGATKNYVDNTALLKAGGIMTGDITLGTNNITGTTGLIQGYNIPALNTSINSATTTANGVLQNTGGDMSGTINSCSIIPVSDNTYNLGSATKKIKDAYIAGGLYTTSNSINIFNAYPIAIYYL